MIASASDVCTMCGSESVHTRFSNLFDDRFGNPDLFNVVCCSECSHCVLSPRLDPADVQSLYETYYGRSVSTTLGEHRSLHSPVVRWILGENCLGQFEADPSIHRKLLDVGSGDCQNLWDAIELGFDAVGYEVDRNSADIARKNGLQLLVAESIENLFEQGQFDWIQMNQVLEHSLQPRALLSEVHRILSPSGSIFIATPNGRSIFNRLFNSRWINWHVPFHQHCFSIKSLRVLLDKAGFSVVEARTVTPVVWLLLQIRRSLTRVEMGDTSPLWMRGSKVRGQRIFEVLILGLLFVPVRIVDWFGFGDCQVVIAKHKP